MNNNNNNTPSSDVCAVCLAATTVRGGEFLTSPGCCGKWFHQSCILELQKNGKNFCPACMAPFPAAPVLPFGACNAQPQPVPVFGPPPPPVSGFSNQAPPQYGFGAPPQQPIAFGAPPQQPIPFGAPQPPSFVFGNYGPPRSPFPPQHIAQQQQQQLFGNFGNYRPDPTPTINYDTSEDEISSEPIKTDKTVKKVDPTANDHLSITLSPEFAEENLDEKFPFHVRVSTTFNATSAVVEEKTDLDVVCVLDNSGSMSGSKIDNLKAAMEFVISTLGEKDRLSVVTFNSYPTTIQGLWKMTEARKNQSRNIVRAISAGGGTDIYSGMQQGWNMLQQRRTRNPASCMFLLTDGQDGSNLEQKKQLAKTMREQGTALFVFGFGNDHDSAHLIQIANAAEGSFVYVETNDTVIDAFGGAIGTQQGQLLRDIRVNITAGSPNVRVENIQAGSYLSNIGTDRRHALVNFADLYGGERRDFLVQLRLPAIPSAADLYDILSVQAVYRQHGNDAEEFTSPTSNCAIKRVTNDVYSQTVHERDVEVDAQIQRLAITAHIRSAMDLADRSSYEDAKGVLANAKKQLMECAAGRQNHPMITTLIGDINDCQAKVSSQTEYVSFGGRAFMTENSDMHSKQRNIYNKKSSPVSYQCMSSAMQQTSATNFRNSSK